jgi:hypothetical protein
VKKKKTKNKPATVTDLQELRDLDAFISAHGGLAPGRWRNRWPSPSPPPPPPSPQPRKLTRAEREANSRLFR